MSTAIEDREKVAQLMMRLSIATGHGDTIDDLLRELEAALAEREMLLGNMLRALETIQGMSPDESRGIVRAKEIARKALRRHVYQ